MQVAIDDREKQSRIKKAKKYYQDEKYQVFIEQLKYGDYLFHDTCTNIDVIFEYKTIEDYISSIQDNRVFNQALNQSNNYEYHFIIIVGTDKEKQDIIREKQKYTGSYISNKQFYGSFASLVNISSLLQVPNEKIAFMLMGQVAEKCCSDKPVVKRFKKSRGSPAFRLLHNNVSNIGYNRAKKICDELNLVSVGDVFNLSFEDLVGVDGVGRVTAMNILRDLGLEFDL